jgi:hypothetical protein
MESIPPFVLTSSKRSTELVVRWSVRLRTGRLR